MFDILSRWYKQKLVDDNKLKFYVVNGKITAEEYKEITGEEYVAPVIKR